MFTVDYKDKRYHYLAMPGTASRSVGQLFKNMGGFRTNGPHGLNHDLLQKGDVIITTVRNHWDWLASWSTRHEVPFSKFLLDFTGKQTNYPWSVLSNGSQRELFWRFTKLATNVLKYETLESELGDIFIGEKLPKIDVTEREHYRSVYTEGTKRFVAAVFQKEIEKWGYEF